MGRIIDEYEEGEEFQGNYYQGFEDGIDEFANALRNPITLDALVSAKDRITVSAIIKKQAERLNG